MSNHDEKGRTALLFLGIFIIILLGNSLYWLAYYPGGFNLDAYGQWMQAMGEAPPSNWHPFLVTAVYWLLTRMICSLSFCIFSQILLFSLSYACLLMKISRNVNRKWIIVLVAFVVSVNPAIEMNNICLTKDVYFTIEVIWTLYILLDICDNGGLIRIRTGTALALVSILLMLTRHNGFFYAAPMIIALGLLCKDQYKKIAGIAGIALCCVFLINGPCYSALGVTSHENPVGETVGVPMAIMANAYVREPESVPEDVRQFLLELADHDVWTDVYVAGEWDSVKWEIGGTELFREESIGRIIKLSLKTIAECPMASLQSLLWNTRIIWQTVGKVKWNSQVYIVNNKYGFHTEGNAFFRKIADALNAFGMTFIGATLIWNLGGYMLFLVWALYAMIKTDKKKTIFIIPSLAYVLLTLLVLSGPNYRYFYFIPVVVPAVALIVLTDLFRKHEHDEREK